MATKKTNKTEKPEVCTGVREEKLKALEHALADLDKQYGKGAVIRMGEEAVNRDIPVIPTGCLTLDYALGVGGIPRGRVVEIFGPESSGKTTVALHIVAQAQKEGGIAAFVDAEHALDPAYAKKLGVNVDELYVSQPDTGEQALEITEALVRSGALDVVVIDSVAALVPKAEIDGEMGESFVGLQARLMSQALRKLTGIINKTGCVAIFINQLREKVGVLYGSPETTPGGRALKFYSSVRLDVRKGEALKNGTDIVGNRTKVKVVKNKVAPPFRIAEFDIIYGEGVSTEGTLLDLAVERNIIQKSGAFFSYEGQRLAQGRDNARLYLKSHPELTAEIDQKVRAELFASKAADAAEAEDIQNNEEEDDLALLEEELQDE
ncbi:MAG: recombinase RecA [Clostridia bacterium]|nr:recombinase RecA [Clostridia bacterium]